METCDVCEHYDQDSECDHGGGDYRNVEWYYDRETAPKWCPLNLKQSDRVKCTNSRCVSYRPLDQGGKNCSKYAMPEDNCDYGYTNEVNIKTGDTKMGTEKKFDFDKMAQVKGNAVNALDTSKNVIVQLQKGRTVVAVVKASLKKAPGAPDALKLLLDTPYGDAVIGMILHTMAPVLTANDTIISAVKAANVAGAVSISDQFTFIQDAVVNAIESIPEFNVIKGMVEGKIDEVIEEYVECPECEGKFKSSTLRDGLCRNCWNHSPDDTQAGTKQEGDTEL